MRLNWCWDLSVVSFGLVLAASVRTPVDWVNLSIGDQNWRLAVADSPSAWVLGLAGREPSDYGMVFDFKTEAADREFWMRGLRYDLDMIWLDDDGQVVAVANNVPHPACFDVEICPPARRSSAQPSRYVIELPAGSLATLSNPLQSVNVASLGP